MPGKGEEIQPSAFYFDPDYIFHHRPLSSLDSVDLARSSPSSSTFSSLSDFPESLKTKFDFSILFGSVPLVDVFFVGPDSLLKHRTETKRRKKQRHANIKNSINGKIT
jgi:hypothetical protein